MKTPLRKCLHCGKEAWTGADLGEFVTSRAAPHGKANKCKECGRAERTLSRYEVTQEQYNEAMSTSVCCEMYGKEEDLVYDHKHATREFRGVLCRTCNQEIGILQDNPKITNKATQYLLQRGYYGE